MTGAPGATVGAGEAARLRHELGLARQAAQQAYRESSGLIRLLAVISEPTSPDVLIERTLSAMSEIFSADVTCLVYCDAHTSEIIAACGFAEDEEQRLPSLPGAPMLSENRLMAWSCPEGEVAPTAAGVAIRSAAFIPLAHDVTAGEGLLLLRADPHEFTPSELQMLESVTARLRTSLEESERRGGIERLARTGHRLTRQLELRPMLDEALRVLCDMTGAQAASAIIVQDGIASLEVEIADQCMIGGNWPLPAQELDAWPSALRGKLFVQRDLKDVSPETDRWEPEWLRSLVVIPVMHDGTPIALMYAGHSRPGFFSRPTVDAVAVLAGYVGAALVNAGLYSALTESESKLRVLTEELRLRATHDSLTGLANRDLARQLLESSLVSNEPGRVGLLFCDLDKFKAINDRLGHEAGDDLLRQVAVRLAACVRTGDLLARLGGDEFLIVLPNVADLDAVTQVGEHVLEALIEPFALGGERVRVAASVGGVVADRDPDSSQAVNLLRDADAAMYEAKNRGRGRVEVFDRFTAQKAVDQLALREDLLTALERRELELYYQPIVDLVEERVIGFEALLRWHHRELGAIAPVVFIPMAEETGAISSIGAWVLSEACLQLARWNHEVDVPLTMAINVSPIQLLDPEFAAKSLRTILGSGLRPQQVWLEVTENIEVTDELTDQLRRLRDVGVRVAMDDFGMSYSNLGYLKHLPVASLKIDRSFIGGLVPGASGGGGMDRGIVRAVLAIAESAGMSVLAEGIETEEQREVLLELGCGQGQGYLFARPMPAQAATNLLVEAMAGLPIRAAGPVPIPVPRVPVEFPEATGNKIK